MENEILIDNMINKAKEAQKEFEKWSQEDVNQIVRAIGRVVFDNAEDLALLAVNETGMGNYHDKVQKNRGKASLIWNDLKDKKSVGIISEDFNTGIVEIAKPIGVISAICPTTNPIVTPMCNSMFAVKGRNAIIIAPHPRAKKCTSYTIKLINESLKELGAPDNLIQVIEEPTLDLTNKLMRMSDTIIATGGSSMVKSAYSSGKPSYGVGPGNVQVIFDRNIDFDIATKMVVQGRSFDNGIICSGEQSTIIHEEDYNIAIDYFSKNGAYFISDPIEKKQLLNVLFINGILNKDIVGQSAIKIAELAGLSVPSSTKVIIAEADGPGNADLLCKEKMCPVITTLKYANFDEALFIAQTNLNLEGKGHSSAIHSNNDTNIKKAGDRLTVSRLLVNQPSSTSAGGSFFNGFAPTTTLGCGTWGNNSESENITYKHLINISRIGYKLNDMKVPDSKEIWE